VVWNRYQPERKPFAAICRLSTLLFGLLLLAVATRPAWAVTCTVAASMSPSARAALFLAADRVGQQILHGQDAALKAGAIPSLAATFQDVDQTLAAVAPQLADAHLDITNLYDLDAGDLKSTENDVQFFCGVSGSQLLVTVTLGSLPPGHYALAVAHATDVKAPAQFSLVLQNTGTEASPHWLLAGLDERPSELAGRDSVWFWSQARALKTKGDDWSSFFYYQAANYLARPSDLYTSPNLEKLSREAAAVEPKNLPGGRPMLLADGAQSFQVTGLRIDDGLGALDLRVEVRAAGVADPVAARKDALAVMAALLAAHPGMRTAFHGIWVYETTPAGQSFAIEQPMSALP
jgi:hypothetical protein